MLHCNSVDLLFIINIRRMDYDDGYSAMAWAVRGELGYNVADYRHCRGLGVRGRVATSAGKVMTQNKKKTKKNVNKI